MRPDRTSAVVPQQPDVRYAYEIVVDGEKMSPWDQLTLHAMGVTWCDGRNKCNG